MIKVTYPTSGDRGESLGPELVGYFNNKRKAREELRGLCPWDFNNMWAGGRYDEFNFEEVPGKLGHADIKFIIETNERLVNARIHAEEWSGSWHSRAPKTW